MGTPRQSLIVLSTWTNPVMGGGELFLEKLTRTQSAFFKIYLLSNNKTVIDYLDKYTSLVEENRIQNNFLFNLVSLFQLRKKIGKNHTVILNGQGAFYYVFICKILFSKVVAIQHSSIYLDEDKWKQKLKFFLLSFVDTAICVSNTLAKELDLLKTQVVVIYNWIEASYLERTKGIDYNSLGQVFNILYIGRLEEPKGIKELVLALEEIENIQLTILGEGFFTSWIKLGRMASKISLMGWQPDIIPFMKDTHLLVMPSHSEGFSFVPIEVGIAGVPSLISDIPVHKEISDNGEFAFLFSKGSVHSLREQIIRLSENRLLLTEMSNKIKKHYEDNFLESDKFVNAYRKVFEIL